MIYMIVTWNQEDLKWEIVYYSHQLTDFLRACKRYPEEKGYVHMVKIKAIKFYEIQIKGIAYREKLLAEAEGVNKI